MPRPAVIHWTSPWPKRAVAPSESEWSMKPRRARVTVSKPRWGCCGKPGHDVAVVHPPAVLALEVHADLAAREDAAGPMASLPGGRIEVVDAEQERVERLQGNPSGNVLSTMGSLTCTSGKLDSIPGYDGGR